MAARPLDGRRAPAEQRLPEDQLKLPIDQCSCEGRELLDVLRRSLVHFEWVEVVEEQFPDAPSHAQLQARRTRVVRLEPDDRLGLTLVDGE